MKKLFFLIVLSLFILNVGKSARVISQFEIAQWFLDSDLAFIGTVNSVDTIIVREVDTLMNDGYRWRCNIIKEVYGFTTDSIIKAQNNCLPDKPIMTPEFYPDHSRTMKKREFDDLDQNGDSIFLYHLQMQPVYNDFSWFRLYHQDKRLVILKKIDDYYEILYQSECNPDFLEFISEVRRKGQSYFDMFKPN